MSNTILGPSGEDSSVVSLSAETILKTGLFYLVTKPSKLI